MHCNFPASARLPAQQKKRVPPQQPAVLQAVLRQYPMRLPLIYCSHLLRHFLLCFQPFRFRQTPLLSADLIKFHLHRWFLPDPARDRWKYPPLLPATDHLFHCFPAFPKYLHHLLFLTHLRFPPNLVFPAYPYRFLNLDFPALPNPPRPVLSSPHPLRCPDPAVSPGLSHLLFPRIPSHLSFHPAVFPAYLPSRQAAVLPVLPHFPPHQKK